MDDVDAALAEAAALKKPVAAAPPAAANDDTDVDAILRRVSTAAKPKLQVGGPGDGLPLGVAAPSPAPSQSEADAWGKTPWSAGVVTAANGMIGNMLPEIAHASDQVGRAQAVAADAAKALPWWGRALAMMGAAGAGGGAGAAPGDAPDSTLARAPSPSLVDYQAAVNAAKSGANQHTVSLPLIGPVGAGTLAGLGGDTVRNVALGPAGLAANIAGNAVASGVDAANEGQSTASALKTAALAGGETAALGGLGKLIGRVRPPGAPDLTVEQRELQQVAGDFSGTRSIRKIQTPLAQALSRDVEQQPIAAPTVAERDLLLKPELGFRETADAARREIAAGNREGAQQILDEAKEAVSSSAEPAKQAVDAVSHARVGDIDNDFQRAIFEAKGKHGTDLAVKALEDARSSAMSRWSTVDGKVLAEDLRRAVRGDVGTAAEKAAAERAAGMLETAGRVTRGDVASALGDGTSSQLLRDTVEKRGFSFDPDARRPYSDLRAAVTSAQDTAANTLGSIAETERHKIVDGISKQLNSSLENHLNRVASASPDAAAAVVHIRNADVYQRLLARLSDANKQAIKVGAIAGPSLGRRVAGVGSGVVSAEELLHAGEAALSGDPLRAAGHLGGAAAARLLPQVVDGTARNVNRLLLDHPGLLKVSRAMRMAARVGKNVASTHAQSRLLGGLTGLSAARAADED